MKLISLVILLIMASACSTSGKRDVASPVNGPKFKFAEQALMFHQDDARRLLGNRQGHFYKCPCSGDQTGEKYTLIDSDEEPNLKIDYSRCLIILNESTYEKLQEDEGCQ